MKLGVLVVTFNRLKQLKKLLLIYKTSEAFDYLVIVNNKSTDGTTEYLEQLNQPNTKIFNLEENTGGSGGFHYGLNYMLNLDLDWIYLSDDDAFPENDIFSEFKKKIAERNTDFISAICTSVIDNGEYDLNHRRSIKRNWLQVKEVDSSYLDYCKEEFEINLYSFVGTFINKKKLNVNNLPEKNYFIWFDDSEHSIQLNKIGKIYCWPKLRVIHNSIYEEGITWKAFYGVRNRLHAYRKHFGNKIFYFKCFKIILISIVFINIDILKINYAAITAARKNILGIHEIYKPGWKLNQHQKK